MMQQKMLFRLSQAAFCAMALSLPLSSEGSIAYIPQTLRECVSVVAEFADLSSDTQNLHQLHAMIKENRILACGDMTRQAVAETLNVVKNYKNELQDDNHYDVVSGYLNEYLNSLDSASILLAMKSENAQSISWALSLVSRCLADCSVARDMIHLSSELTGNSNIELCGNVVIDSSLCSNVNMRAVANVLQNANKAKGHAASTVYFNANSMDNAVLTGPNMIFGTGVTSPSINAWAMLPSGVTQSPINMQFPVPRKLDKNKPLALELYFLISNQGGGTGLANVMVNAEYLQDNSSFDISDVVPSFTHTVTSGNFAVTEPTDLNSVQMVSVTIPLPAGGLRKSTFILFSVTRIAPVSGTEYPDAIFLSAANFRYVTK